MGVIMLKPTDAPQSYSQNGQDTFITGQLFPGLRNGVFIEIGAFDGETFSNSALLERNLGWNGICIEPLPGAFAKLAASRACTCVNAAAGNDAAGKLRFEEIDGYGAMLSGATSTRPAAHHARVVREQQHHGFERRMIEVDMVRPADLLRRHGMMTVDYASIDVEGAEMECLRGLLDPDITVRALSIENNYGETDAHRLLVERGYMRVATIGEDDFYRLRSDCTARDYALLLLNTPRRWSRDRKRRRRALAS